MFEQSFESESHTKANLMLSTCTLADNKTLIKSAYR